MKHLLPWDKRFKVAVGIAEALSYLHHGCPQPVIHRDVKSSNILLNDEFEPQVKLVTIMSVDFPQELTKDKNEVSANSYLISA